MKRTFFFFLLITIAYVLSAFVRTFIIQTYYIPTNSMSPTLEINDRILVIKGPFLSEELDYGDIIVFYPVEESPPSNLLRLINSLNINKLINSEANDPVYIKRVVGKEYDSIKISNTGNLYVNNITQEYEREWIVPAQEYFVLGDNLDSSADSRIYGTINRNNIIGKAWSVIYPLNDIKLIND